MRGMGEDLHGGVEKGQEVEPALVEQIHSTVFCIRGEGLHLEDAIIL